MTLLFLLYLLQLATPAPVRADEPAEKSATSPLPPLLEPAKASAQPTDRNGGSAASGDYLELVCVGAETASVPLSAPLALEPRKP